VDLFRPATMDLCRTTTGVVRGDRRLCLVDATVEQDGQPVARASALFLEVGDPATGEVWDATRSVDFEVHDFSEDPRSSGA